MDKETIEEAAERIYDDNLFEYQKYRNGFIQGAKWQQEQYKCPNCKQETYSHFCYKTGEEYINCSDCGYHRSATIVNRSKNPSELTEQGWEIREWEIKEVKNPYGAYKIKYYDAPGYIWGSLETEHQYKQLLKRINDDTNVEFSFFSRLIDNKIKVDILVDNRPKGDSYEK